MKKSFYMTFWVLALVTCVGVTSCDEEYKGLEISFDSFLDDETTTNTVSMQKNDVKEDTMKIDVMIGTIPDLDLRSVLFQVTYDPDLLEFTGFKDSEYFGKQYTTTSVDLHFIDSGIVEVHIAREEGGETPVDGLGKLMELHFRAIAFMEDEAELGICKGINRKSNFSYLHFDEEFLGTTNGKFISGISWYGGVCCIFDNQ